MPWVLRLLTSALCFLSPMAVLTVWVQAPSARWTPSTLDRAATSSAVSPRVDWTTTSKRCWLSKNRSAVKRKSTQVARSPVSMVTPRAVIRRMEKNRRFPPPMERNISLVYAFFMVSPSSPARAEPRTDPSRIPPSPPCRRLYFSMTSIT